LKSEPTQNADRHKTLDRGGDGGADVGERDPYGSKRRYQSIK